MPKAVKRKATTTGSNEVNGTNAMKKVCKKRFSKRNKYLHLALQNAGDGDPDVAPIGSPTQSCKQKRATKTRTTEQQQSSSTPPKTKSEDGKLSKTRARKNTTDAIISNSLTLKERMEHKLQSSQFRYINEQLYSTTGDKARKLFKMDPTLFDNYHAGFRQQVDKWPVNPLQLIIKFVVARPSSLVVADFGCGDALLARTVRNTVHSFDLVAANERVTSCDMRRVPLEDESVDIAVFCLSLMGQNIVPYLCESHRVLKFKGILKIAEVESRFSDMNAFVGTLERLGFVLDVKDTSHKMFVMFQFKKVNPLSNKAKKLDFSLNTCMYKKR